MSNREPASNSLAAPDEWAPTEVHDWEGKERDVLVLNYTLACPLQCDFCCYGCHPKRKEKMPLELAIDLVRQAGAMKNFSSVGFTGGEAMLFPEEVIEIGKECRRWGLPITLATAAHWGEDPEQADALVDRLKEVGLIRMNISHDPSHKAYVSDKSVINVARSAARAGIATYVVGTFYEPDDSMETFLPALVNVDRINLVTKYVAKVGRALKKDITQGRYRLSLALSDLACYRREYHDIVVFYDGKTYPCCSTFNRATPGILLGNAAEVPLRTLWERANGSLMMRVMKRQSFAELYDIIRNYDPELHATLPDPKGAVGPCSLCNQLFAKPESSERIRAVFERYERDRVEQVLAMLQEQLGTERAHAMVARLAAPASDTVSPVHG